MVDEVAPRRRRNGPNTYATAQQRHQNHQRNADRSHGPPAKWKRGTGENTRYISISPGIVAGSTFAKSFVDFHSALAVRSDAVILMNTDCAVPPYSTTKENHL